MKKLLLAGLAAISISSSAMAFQCTYEIINNRGRVVDAITVGSDISPAQACTKARVACEGLSRNHGYGARCVESRRGGFDPYPYPDPRPNPNPRPRPGNFVTRTCSATLMERGYYRDFPVATFSSTATGVRNTGVQARACNQAQRECDFSRRFDQYCVVDRF